jgi:hypothetical protein
MDRKLLPGSILFLAASMALAQANPAPQQMPQQQNTPQQSGAVSWQSLNQMNSLLGELDATARAATSDLSRVRIDKWKTDSGTKHQTQANADSILRNLQSALPGIVTAVRNSPDDVAANFKLYRNLDALYDVLGSVAESAGAFGSKNDYQALANDLGNLERVRRELADRVESLAGAKESELARLRTTVRAAQAAAQTPAKKVIVDENEPVKKPPRKKKSTASTQASPAAAKPATPQ